MPQSFRSRLRICVHAGKKEFGFQRSDAWTNELHLFVVSRAENNEANAEIERECTALFGAPVKIVRGTKSPHKILDVALSPTQLQEKVRQLLLSKTK